MNIWILTRPEYHQMHHIRRLKEEAEKSKIEFHLMDPNQFDIIVTKEGKKSIRYEGNDVQLPDCVISRISPVKNYFTQAVIRKLESLGVFTLNASTSMELARDKLATLQCLAQHNIPIPKTMLAKFPLNIESIEREFTYPLIFKSVSGSKGKGVFLCENRNKLEDIQDLLEMSNPKDIQAILQEFIA
ncbi:MAG: ATP-grasp domain-containing protein, partial [Candidatus Woesearchaeota archaeon]